MTFVIHRAAAQELDCIGHAGTSRLGVLPEAARHPEADFNPRADAHPELLIILVHNPRAPVQNGTAELSATRYSGRAFLSARPTSGPVPSKAAFEGTVTKQTATIVSELRRMTARFEQHGHEMASPRAVHTPPGGQARTPMGQTTKTMTFEVQHDRRQMDRLQVPVCLRCDSVSRVRPKFRTREQVYFHCVSCGQYMVELKPDHPPSPDMTLARATPSH